MREKKQVDLLCRDPQGQLVTIEIAGNPDHEAHNALFCVGVPDLQKHIVVCLTNPIVKAVKKKFQGFPELNNNPKIEVVTLAQLLSEKYQLG